MKKLTTMRVCLLKVTLFYSRIDIEWYFQISVMLEFSKARKYEQKTIMQFPVLYLWVKRSYYFAYSSASLPLWYLCGSKKLLQRLLKNIMWNALVQWFSRINKKVELITLCKICFDLRTNSLLWFNYFVQLDQIIPTNMASLATFKNHHVYVDINFVQQNGFMFGNMIIFYFLYFRSFFILQSIWQSWVNTGCLLTDF